MKVVNQGFGCDKLSGYNDEQDIDLKIKWLLASTYLESLQNKNI